MPARRSTLFAMSPTARPTPCGAGFSTTSTEPLRPITLNGRVWARQHPHSQEPQPRLISIMLSFALSIARRTDFATARTTEAREAVLVADDARDHEVHAATGVGHPLHHVDVEDLILGL